MMEPQFCKNEKRKIMKNSINNIIESKNCIKKYEFNDCIPNKLRITEIEKININLKGKKSPSIYQSMDVQRKKNC